MTSKEEWEMLNKERSKSCQCLKKRKAQKRKSDG